MAKVALLVGVSEYEVGLNPLPAAVKDVVALERILKDSEMGDFDEVKTLTNPDPQTMQYEVETLFSGRSKDDFVLLFFSGHGIKDDSNNLYFATRITKKSAKGDLIRSTAVPARFVHEVMNNSRAKRQAIILDCCFSGAFDPSLQSKDDGSIDLKGQLGAEGRVVLTSSSSTQYSFEQQGSDLSLYTRYLIEGIETGAGDRDEDGKISVRELHDYATSKVQETAPSMTPKLITLKDLGFDLVLAKAKVTDPKLRYRRQVEKYSSRGAISSIGRTILDRLQVQLRISLIVVGEIESEVLRPYQERLDNLHRYQQAFEAAVKNEYPLRNYVQSELEDLLEILGLRREDVDPIEKEIIAHNAQNLKATSEEYQQKLKRYEQELRRAVEVEYPLSSYSRNGLNDFQKSLGLKSEDVERIESPILAQKYQQQIEAEELKQREEKEKLSHQNNLQRYEQELYNVIETEYPFRVDTRNGLKNLQQSLGLNDEDVAQIESSILQTKKSALKNSKTVQLYHEQKNEQNSTDTSSTIDKQKQLISVKQKQKQNGFSVLDNRVIFIATAFSVIIGGWLFFFKSTTTIPTVEKTPIPSVTPTALTTPTSSPNPKKAEEEAKLKAAKDAGAKKSAAEQAARDRAGAEQAARDQAAAEQAAAEQAARDQAARDRVAAEQAAADAKPTRNPRCDSGEPLSARTQRELGCI